MEAYETVDLDGYSGEEAWEVMLKMQRNGCEPSGPFPSSSLNGYHVLVRCKCGGCRLVFDDAVRLGKDLQRPRFARDVLFSVRRRKVYLETSVRPVLRY